MPKRPEKTPAKKWTTFQFGCFLPSTRAPRRCERQVKYVKGRKTIVWVPTRERNEALDTYVYSLVAFHILNPDLEKIANKTLTTEEQQEEQPTKEPQARDLAKERRRPNRKKSFVKDW